MGTKSILAFSVKLSVLCNAWWILSPTIMFFYAVDGTENVSDVCFFICICFIILCLFFSVQTVWIFLKCRTHVGQTVVMFGPNILIGLTFLGPAFSTEYYNTYKHIWNTSINDFYQDVKLIHFRPA